LFAEDAVNQPKYKGTLIQKASTMTDTKIPVENAGRIISAANASDLAGILAQLTGYFARVTGAYPDPISADKDLAGIGRVLETASPPILAV
jgi:hypothetical protein